MDNADIDHTFFPVSHRECGGDVAVHIDVKAAIQEVLFPSPKPELGPPPGYLAKVLTGVDYDSEAEMFIRRMYGLNVRLFDLTAGQQREIPLDVAVKLVKAFREREKRGGCNEGT